MKGYVKRNYLYVAFGAGCAVSLFLPAVWTTRILAVTVIVLGVLCCQKPHKPEKPHC